MGSVERQKDGSHLHAVLFPRTMEPRRSKFVCGVQSAFPQGAVRGDGEPVGYRCSVVLVSVVCGSKLVERKQVRRAVYVGCVLWRGCRVASVA